MQENKLIKILIVEDSPTQALLLKETLEQNDFTVMVARDGAEALQMIQSNPLNLIISDIAMPRMNGYELCQNIKSHTSFKKLPVVLLTNLTDPLDVIKGVECGADSFLTKPYEVNLLLSCIADVLENIQVNQGMQQEERELEFAFREMHYKLKVHQTQVLSLLLSTYSSAMQKNSDLEIAYQKLNAVVEEVEQKNQELVKLNSMKNQFLGMAAHDLRSPLSLIEGYSQLLLEKFCESTDPEVLKMLERIQRSSAFMLRLINDLLDISTIESGKLNLNFKKVNIIPLIRDLLSFKRSLAERKGIKLDFKCEKKSLDFVCDSDKLEQILENLISNAIKFSHSGTTIEVAIQSLLDEILFTVKDQGVGIPYEERELLFQPFSKISTKATAGESSSGLGLAIVKKIVMEHNGKIWVDSEVGVGTTFFVSFPNDQSQHVV